MRKIYGEGRCKQCGQRVTVERGSEYHYTPDDRPCGPVETNHPSAVADRPAGTVPAGTARPVS